MKLYSKNVALAALISRLFDKHSDNGPQRADVCGVSRCSEKGLAGAAPILCLFFGSPSLRYSQLLPEAHVTSSMPPWPFLLHYHEVCEHEALKKESFAQVDF